MRLLAAEGTKLIRMPVLWGFICLCMLLNLLLVTGADRYARDWNAASEIISQCGIRPDLKAVEELAAAPDADRSLREIAASLPEAGNVFETYDVSALSDFYAQIVENSPGALHLVRSKYAALEERREDLAEAEAALDLYAGPVTKEAHQYLFGTIMCAVLCEGIVIGVLSMLSLLGYEGLRKTAAMTAGSRVGRRLGRTKILAGVLWSAAVYLVLFGTAMLMLSAVFELPAVFSSSVSSGYNYFVDMLVRRPFFTWADFTAGEYTAAVMAAGTVLCIVFSLIAALFGLLVRNTYTALLAVTLFLGTLCCAQVFAAQTGNWTAYAVLTFQPLSTLLSVNAWFTELGLSAFVPWQETLSAAICLVLAAAAAFCALRASYRKDIVL